MPLKPISEFLGQVIDRLPGLEASGQGDRIRFALQSAVAQHPGARKDKAKAVVRLGVAHFVEPRVLDYKIEVAKLTVRRAARHLAKDKFVQRLAARRGASDAPDKRPAVAGELVEAPLHHERRFNIRSEREQ
jgi:hypothetical protein